jgi:hypothetical protein
MGGRSWASIRSTGRGRTDPAYRSGGETLALGPGVGADGAPRTGGARVLSLAPLPSGTSEALSLPEAPGSPQRSFARATWSATHPTLRREALPHDEEEESPE